MPMNKTLQVHIIQKKFDNQGVPDADLKGLIDASITLTENVRNLEEKGFLKGKVDYYNGADIKEKVLETQLKQAVEALEETKDLSKKQIETDSGITASKVFEPPLTELEFQEWLNKPNEFDIKGVDTEEDALAMQVDFNEDF